MLSIRQLLPSGQSALILQLQRFVPVPVRPELPVPGLISSPSPGLFPSVMLFPSVEAFDILFAGCAAAIVYVGLRSVAIIGA